MQHPHDDITCPIIIQPTVPKRTDPLWAWSGHRPGPTLRRRSRSWGRCTKHGL